jgi:hypothetical protein
MSSYDPRKSYPAASSQANALIQKNTSRGLANETPENREKRVAKMKATNAAKWQKIREDRAKELEAYKIFKEAQKLRKSLETSRKRPGSPEQVQAAVLSWKDPETRARRLAASKETQLKTRLRRKFVQDEIKETVEDPVMAKVPLPLPPASVPTPRPPTGAPHVSYFDTWFPFEGEKEPTELDCAFAAFLHPEETAERGSRLTKVDFFWHIVSLLWGPASTRHFQRHPWVEKMVNLACHSNYVGISGCASSGKSDFGAVWSIVNWLAAPNITKVLATSTGLKEARNRIWGKIEDYWLFATQKLPGKLVSSIGQLRMEGDDRVATTGIELIAGDPSKEKEAIGKLIGIKAPRVIMVADELPELSENILSAAYSNLATNPYFQLIGLGNFKSTLDAFGTFTEPTGGWPSVSVEAERWETKRGWCIHLDGTKSPNLAFETDRWPVYGHKQLEEHLKLGENTALFWRMCRSFMAPVGVADYIYTEAELMQGGAFDATIEWASPLIRLAALDPAFTNDGDRAMLVFGSLGTAANGRQVLRLDRYMQLREDVTKSEPLDFQLVNLFKAECEREGVQPGNAAFDATGAGISFGSVVEALWSNYVLPIRFGGSASELSVDAAGTRLAKEVYGNRVSELWYQGREYVRARQIVGVTRDLARELIARKYFTRKSINTTIVVEPKTEMKMRMGMSPDLADAFLMMVELARVKHGWFPAGFGRRPKAVQDEDTMTWVRQLDNIYDDANILAGY